MEPTSNSVSFVTGALVGSSGAILSFIMCRAMNRNFIAVIAGGFGSTSGGDAAEIEGDVDPIEVGETVQMLHDANNIMIIPGYGMAVAQAQHTVNEIAKLLGSQGKTVRFGIHPVAGRMPGHTKSSSSAPSGSAVLRSPSAASPTTRTCAPVLES